MIEHSSCKEKYREGSERAKFEMAEKLSVLSCEFQSSFKKNIKQNKKEKKRSFGIAADSNEPQKRLFNFGRIPENMTSKRVPKNLGTKRK